MAKFGINDILNAKSKAGAAGTTEYKEIYLSPYEVKPAEENTHTTLENIEELADCFLTVGQEQPTVLARVNGEYRIVDGHRRNAANIYNLERGYKQYEKVLYRYRDMTEAMYELSLLVGNGLTQGLTPYERMRTAERLKAALVHAKKEGSIEIKGKMRDMVANMLDESSTNIARMESINKNATDEIKEQLKAGNIGITVAYEATKLPEDEQREIAQRAADGQEIRAKEITEKVAERKAAEKEKKEDDYPLSYHGEIIGMNPPEEPKRPGDDYETPHPESITSLCYSCKNYSTCNVKTGTCQKCDQYINKAEAEKTEEQRYSEEQDKIDRQTRERMRQQEDEKKMDNLPSDREENGQKTHSIRLAAMHFEDVASGKKTFELRKNDRGYKEGDILELMEFTDGRNTGRSIKALVTYMLEEYTGLEDGYCIMGIKVIPEVSETDTEGEKTDE